MSDHTLTRLSLLLVIACVAACERGANADVPSTTSVTDSAGVQIVQNTDPALDTMSVQLAEVLRIGVVEGAEEYQLYNVRDIAVDADGRIFVANGGSLSIRVYAPDGRYLKQFGRAGEGPGEFRRIAMPILWRDTVFAYDPNRWQASFFDTTGAHLASFRYNFHEWGMLPVVAATERGWVVQVRPFYPGREAASVGKALVDTTRLGFLPARIVPEIAHMTLAQVDTAVRTIVTYPGGRSFGMRAREGGEGPVGVLMNPPFFEPFPQHAVSGSGHIFVARGYPYVVDVFDFAGGHIRSIRRAHQAVAITDEHIQRLLAHVDAHYDTIGGREMNLRRRYETQAGFPRIGFLPVTGRLLGDDRGGVWVQRADIVADPVDVEWSRGARPPSYWDVFDDNGVFQHIVKLPPRFTPRAVRDSTIYGIARDELDVQYVVAYRVRAVSPGQ